MKNCELIIRYKEYSKSELSEEYKKFIETAIEAAQNAYSPYSKFKVGVCLELSDGTLLKGNNQENAAYPSGLCAERVAVFYANANFPNLYIKTLTIVALDENNQLINELISPCGSCRQVIAESEYRYNKNIKILLAGKTVLEFNSVNDLLPFVFCKEIINK